jgi:hypothetical protein
VAAKKQDKFTAKKENDEIPTGLHTRTHTPSDANEVRDQLCWLIRHRKGRFFLLLSHRTCTNLALQVGS